MLGHNLPPFAVIPKDEFFAARRMNCSQWSLHRWREPMTLGLILPSSNQTKQRRAPEEDNEEGNGECLALLADDDLSLSDHRESLRSICLNPASCPRGELFDALTTATFASLPETKTHKGTCIAACAHRISTAAFVYSSSARVEHKQNMHR